MFWIVSCLDLYQGDVWLSKHYDRMSFQERSWSLLTCRHWTWKHPLNQFHVRYWIVIEVIYWSQVDKSTANGAGSATLHRYHPGMGDWRGFLDNSPPRGSTNIAWARPNPLWTTRASALETASSTRNTMGTFNSKFIGPQNTRCIWLLGTREWYNAVWLRDHWMFVP